jgi:hypothetical protein
MATAKKKPYYLSLSTATDALVLQLDPDIYDTEIQTATGLTATKGSITKTLKCTVKQAISSSFAGRIRLTCTKGANTAEEETRRVEIVCEASSLDTAKAALLGKTVKLGYGANAVDWEITGAA